MNQEMWKRHRFVIGEAQTMLFYSQLFLEEILADTGNMELAELVKRIKDIRRAVAELENKYYSDDGSFMRKLVSTLTASSLSSSSDPSRR